MVKLAKNTSTMIAAMIQTHILATRPSEHKSNALIINRSTMALHVNFWFTYLFNWTTVTIISQVNKIGNKLLKTFHKMIGRR